MNEAALLQHADLLDALGDAIDRTTYRALESAATDIHIDTMEAIRARLLRLRPDLEDLIDLATRGETDWYVHRQPWEGKEVDA